MARKTATTERGNYIRKCGYIDIYQKPQYKTVGDWRSKKLIPIGATVDLYHAKYKLDGGFKSHAEAEKRAMELIDHGIRKPNVKYSKQYNKDVLAYLQESLNK